MRRDPEGISDPSDSDDEVERAQPSSRAMPVKVVLLCYVPYVSASTSVLLTDYTS